MPGVQVGALTVATSERIPDHTPFAVYVSQLRQSGFWMIAATADTNTALAQRSACRLAWGNESAVILGDTYTGNDMSALYVSLVPAGAYNPWKGAAP